ncbi:MAG: hypothetical protein ACI32F_03550 [Allobaculum sp.]
MSKLVYSISAAPLEKQTLAHHPKAQIRHTLARTMQMIRNRIIEYIIDFDEKVESDTLTVKDYIFPFLCGCVIFQLFFMLVNI